MLPQFRFVVKGTKTRDKFWVYDKDTKKRVSDKFTTHSEATREQMKITQQTLKEINQ